MSKSKSILLLEDNDDLLLSFYELFNLEKPEYNIVAFRNGKDAWEELSSYKTKYDAIILDNMVAGLSGMELAKKISNDDHLKNIPVIMQSGKIEDHVIQKAYDAGVCKYLTKPYSISEFIKWLVHKLENLQE